MSSTSITCFVSSGTKQMGTEGLHMIRGPPPLYKLLLMDTTPDGRFAADVKLWNDSAIPPPPPSTAPGAKKPTR